eukprot:TRINITY_DN3153_c1_g3_i2.p3 TRINITY_DN3153_c1_g3~~TRINITY_DN3153_c1_g3_i2.p3  ORF type:complete len:147 (+),score=52.70 TRINITY_DN3153_c1_g3_i2:27-443(+)
MERAARAFELEVVCNLALQREAEYEHTLLLVPRFVLLLKTTCVDEPPTNLVNGDTDDGAHPVYELQVVEAAKESDPTEWLYEIGKRAEAWAPYNTAMRSYLNGMCTDDAASQAESLQRACRTAILRLGNHKQPLVVYP